MAAFTTAYHRVIYYSTNALLLSIADHGDCTGRRSMDCQNDLSLAVQLFTAPFS